MGTLGICRVNPFEVDWNGKYDDENNDELLDPPRNLFSLTLTFSIEEYNQIKNYGLDLFRLGMAAKSTDYIPNSFKTRNKKVFEIVNDALGNAIQSENQRHIEIMTIVKETTDKYPDYYWWWFSNS